MRRRVITSIAIALVLGLLPVRVQAQSSTPREQLQQYVLDLQKNPSDNGLREKIIRLAQELKPAPAIPEEARRHYVKADALIHDAQSPQEAGAAIEEYSKALLEAPWWPEVYRDQGLALEVAGRYEDGKKALKLYLLSHPGEEESRKAQDEIYRIEAKEDSVARKQHEEEAKAIHEREEQEAAKREVEREFAYILGTWNYSTQVPPRFSVFKSPSGTMEFKFTTFGKVIEGHDSRNLSYPVLRGKIVGEAINWESWEGEIRGIPGECKGSVGWQTKNLQWDASKKSFTYYEPILKLFECLSTGEIERWTFSRP